MNNITKKVKRLLADALLPAVHGGGSRPGYTPWQATGAARGAGPRASRAPAAGSPCGQRRGSWTPGCTTAPWGGVAAEAPAGISQLYTDHPLGLGGGFWAKPSQSLSKSQSVTHSTRGGGGWPWLGDWMAGVRRNCPIRKCGSFIKVSSCHWKYCLRISGSHQWRTKKTESKIGTNKRAILHKG